MVRAPLSRRSSLAFAGKVIVVTGASGNLGRAVCARLAQEGGRVVPFVHTKRSAEERAVELTDERSVEKGFEGISGLWAAVNCAGGGEGGSPLKGTPVELFEDMIGSNPRSTFPVSRAAGRRFGPGGGRVVNVSAADAAAPPRLGGPAAE